jgi:glycerophosphoryl diester phosphodiesterase
VNLLRGDGRPLVIGHRGAAALAPENTLESLAAAVALGCDLVEFDVLELGGELVLAHSPAEAASEPAMFEEALVLLARSTAGPYVDLKQRGIAGPLAATLRRHGLLDRTVLSSFDPGALREVAAEEPRLALGLTYPRDRLGVATRRSLLPAVRAGVGALRRGLPRRIEGLLGRAGAQAAMLHFAVVSPEAIDRCHALGKAVFAWTVNDPALAKSLEDAGIDGIISDDPRILRANT